MFKIQFLIPLVIYCLCSAHATEPSYPITPNEVADVKNLGPGVNSPESDYTPCITTNEKFLFFQSNRSPAIGAEGDFDLWYSMNKNKGVEGAEPLFESSANVGLPVNSESLDGHPSLRKLPSDEYEMYFTSFASATRPGPLLTNIYYTRWHEGKWSVPVPVAEVNSDFHDRMPSISQDGKYLFFSSDRLGGHGSDDIWYSEYNTETQKWGTPKNAGSINTAQSEVTPAIHADGLTLYFSSNHPGGVGGTDIYFTQSLARLAREDEPDIAAKGWSRPLNLGKPFNSEFDDEYPTVIGSGERVYFTSNRSEGMGAYDIYRAKVPLFARPTMRLNFQGKAYTGARKQPVNAKIEITSGEIQYKAETDAAKNSEYNLKVINQKEYQLEAQAEGYRTIKETLDTRQIYETKVVEKNLVFIRDIKLPKKIDLVLEFTDSKGKMISPKAKYRLTPRDKKLQALTLKKGRATMKLLDTMDYKSEEAAITDLDNLVLEVQAKKKGLPDLVEKRPFATILDEFKGQIPEKITVRFIMGAKSAPVVKVEKVQPKEEPKEEPREEVEPETKVAEEPAGEPAKYTLKLMGRLYFDTDVKDKFTGDGDAVIKALYSRWKKTGRARIYVYGHGDNAGERGYNRRLSKERAQYVKKQLMDLGVPRGKIIAKGRGKGRGKRRAEVYALRKIMPAKEAAPPVSSEEK